MSKLTALTYFQIVELRKIAEHDPLLNLTVKASTAEVPYVAETLDAVHGALQRTANRGQRTALHSIKRKLVAAKGAQ